MTLSRFYFRWIIFIGVLCSSCISLKNPCTVAKEKIREQSKQYDFCETFVQNKEGDLILQSKENKSELKDFTFTVCFIDKKIGLIKEEIYFESGDQKVTISNYLSGEGIVNLYQKDIAFFEQGCLNDEPMHYIEIAGLQKSGKQFSCIYYTDKNGNEINDTTNCYLNMSKPDGQISLNTKIISIEDINLILN